MSKQIASPSKTIEELEQEEELRADAIRSSINQAVQNNRAGAKAAVAGLLSDPPRYSLSDLYGDDWQAETFAARLS